MENSKRERLSELISEADKIVFSQSDKSMAYNWLVELEYLLNLSNTQSELLNKIMSAINVFRSTGYAYSRKFSKLKALLKVFKTYELKNMQFKRFSGLSSF